MGLPRRIKLAPVLSLFILLSCQSNYTPKPAGYPRMDLPEKDYILFQSDAPYSFEIPRYAFVEDPPGIREPWWINIVIPELNGKIHISYKPVDNNLSDFIKDSRTLVYKHTSKAEGIEETPFFDESERRYGIVYDLDGNVASAVQFFITDSTNHFIRGSLYFSAKANRDSLNPAIDFLREDIIHLLETTSWKY